MRGWVASFLIGLLAGSALSQAIHVLAEGWSGIQEGVTDPIRASLQLAHLIAFIAAIICFTIYLVAEI